MQRIALTLTVSLLSAPLLAQSAPALSFQNLYEMGLLQDPNQPAKSSGVTVWQRVPLLGQAPAADTSDRVSTPFTWHQYADAFQQDENVAASEPRAGDAWVGAGVQDPHSLWARIPGYQAQAPGAAANEPRPGDVWLGLALRQHKDGDAWLEVLEVLPGSPAGAAGVQPGDKLVASAGQAVESHAGLLKTLRERREGQRVKLGIERTHEVELGTSDDGEQRGMLGVATEESASDLPGGEGEQGVRIEQMTPRSAAQSSGLLPGDRIAAVDGQPVSNVSELREAIRAHGPGETVSLRVLREVEVELARRPGEGQAPRAGSGNDFQPGAGAWPGQQDLEPSDAAPERKPDVWGRSPSGREPAAPPATEPRRYSTPPVPRDPTAPGAPSRRFSAPESTLLLEEIRSLRREVADLRRELESLRGDRR